MEKIILIGGGTHVQYSIDIIQKENKYQILGIVDDNIKVGDELFGFPILGGKEDLQVITKKYNVNNGIITIGDNWIRKNIFDYVSDLVPSFKWVNAIHPSVIIGSNVTLGVGVIAMAGVIFNPGAFIGNFTFYATGCQIEHDCNIGDFASVSAGSVLGGFVSVGRYSAITMNVTIFDRLSIGDNTVVGSASLVTKSLPSNVLAYGNPTKIIRERQKNEKII
jgi:sugar O-acyltransferase (sialic acid O-acetyltransferase NeuD family)|tara:strand:- start:9555 stop:10217 length:663 start_codon:yes stop_codon:yes gene_type:complete